MAARDILYQWMDEAILKIEAHAASIAGGHPEIVEAVEKVRDPIGRDGIRPPDQEHEQVFRLQALAELMEKVDELKGGDVADALEVKTVAELRQMADEKGVEGTSQMRKAQLIQAIREKEDA